VSSRPARHVLVGQQRAQERGVGAQAEHAVSRSAGVEAAQGVGAVDAVRDHLGEHRVVVRADDAPGGDPGVDAHAVRPGQRQHAPAGGQEARGGVLGVEADLDGVPVEPHVLLRDRQRLARGHPQLQLHQVQTGDELGDRVLHLQPGVHLHEEELVRRVGPDDELHRARADVPDPPAPASTAARAHRLPLRRGEQRRTAPPRRSSGGALQAALPLAEVHDAAVGVGQRPAPRCAAGW
jgi:hypothetical protein